MPDTDSLIPRPVNLPEPDDTSTIEGDNPEAIAESIISATHDSRKVRYLGYRSCGFTQIESLALIGVTKYPYKTLNRWRNSDPIFVQHEANLSELKNKLGVEFAHLEFIRNYRLVLAKDYEVITKSLSTQRDDMSNFENQYLLKMRSHYTPQALQTMQELIGAAEKTEGPFDFQKFVLTMQRKTEKTTDTIQISGTKESKEI
jgi:hypothetical protein